MIVSDDSALRNLPARLKPTQTMYLDGIRYSLDMIGVAYERLTESLVQSTPQQKQLPPDLFVLAFLDGWSIVDATNRLRVLLSQMPGMKRSPDLKVMLARLAPFEGLRNSIQHLPGAIVQNAEAGEPTWGSIAWVVSRPMERRLDSCVLVAGSVKGTTRPAINPAGKQLQVPVDLVELTAYGKTVSLSTAFSAAGELAQGLHKSLRSQFGDEPTAGADTTLCIEMSDGVENDI